MRALRKGIVALLSLAAWSAAATAQDKFEHNEKGEWTYEWDDGRHVLKEEQKLDQYKSEYKDAQREVKREAKSDGSWKEEVKDGPCEIKREVTSSGEYKEEHKCD